MPKESLKITANVFRFLVGGLFIFSGFVKIVDPIGTAIKMEKYFHVFSENIASFFDAFVPAAMFLSIFMVSLEIVLGVALIVLFRIRTTAWLLLIMIIYFTILTFYTHLTGEPTDCGCFGDFMKLTPLTSFLKDVVLLGMIVVIFSYRKHFKSESDNKVGFISMFVLTVLTVLFAQWNIYYLPVIDFRAYAVGNSIPEKMTDGKPDNIQTFMIYKNPATDEVREMPMDEYMASKIWEDKSWEYLDRKDVLIEEGEPNSILGFNLINDSNGNDETEEVLEGKQMLISIKEMNVLYKADRHKELELLVENLLENGIGVRVLNSSTSAGMQKLMEEINLTNADIYTFDQDESKAMIRAKVGFVLLNNGVVKGKWSINDFPTLSEVLDKVE